jgi:hypothetical protein
VSPASGISIPARRPRARSSLTTPSIDELSAWHSCGPWVATCSRTDLGHLASESPLPSLSLSLGQHEARPLLRPAPAIFPAHRVLDELPQTW